MLTPLLRSPRLRLSPLAQLLAGIGAGLVGLGSSLAEHSPAGVGVVRVNRTLPVVTAPSTVFSLPEKADAAVLSRVRLFPETLAPVGGEPTAAENAALSDALRTFAASRSLSALDGFIQANPNSRWLATVLLNRGLLRYDAGYFSGALDDWSRAWALGREAKGLSPEADALMVRALAEAVKMDCRIGRVADAKALLAELGDRPTAGRNASMLDLARKAIGQMETAPAECFKCGPFALSTILHHQRAESPQTLGCLSNYPTTPQGTSLAQVAALSQQLGMKMQPARRESLTAAVPIPAVVNWKLNHYGALLEQKDGRYLLTDPTFGTSQWIGAEAIAQESSGYFLIPAGPLPAGWVAVDEKEAGTVWGRGNCPTPDGSPTGPNAPQAGGPPGGPKGPSGCGMATWSFHTALASLRIYDIPLGYRPPVGPTVNFLVNYSQMEQNQPTTLNYSNVGPLWNFSFLAYLTVDSTAARAHMGEGGTELFTNFNGTTYDPEQFTGALMVRVSATVFERRATDGSKMVFNLPDGSGRVFLTQVIDPQGNAATVTYDANFRLVAVTDAIGQVTTVTHGSDTVADPAFYRVTRVTDPFGRFTTLTYTANGQLASVTDVIGITSQFRYNAANLIDRLTTPYGNTDFSFGTTNVAPAGVVTFVEVLEANGSRQRVEFVQTSVTPPTEAAVPVGMPTHNDYMQWRNSYFWDRKAMADAPGDYSKARLTHFLHFNVSNIKGSVIESTKAPLEGRVWYYYQDQGNDSIYTREGMRANPTHIGRVLDDGTTQLDRYTYNDKGNLTQAIDPLGRTTNYTYAANGLDVLNVSQVNAQGGSDRLATFTWNAQHQPLTFADAAGSTLTFSYNTRGQVLATTNARSETTTFVYDPNGYLLSIDGPLVGASDQITFTYDAFGRVRTTVNAEGYAATFDYDNLDRWTKTTYPDGTYDQVTYTALDATSLRDRLARVTTFAYNAVRQPVTVTDALARTTTMEWCNCGSLRRLSDPLGRSITWEQDVQGRPISKTYPDGSVETYVYESTTSRQIGGTNARGQSRFVLYNADDTTAGVFYPAGSPSTASVTYAWDSAYPRLTAMRDGTGLTTYAYGPVTGGVSRSANRVVEVNTAWTNSRVTFGYDELGRTTSRSINGSTESCVRESLGRITAASNALGSFAFSYEGISGRISRTDLPNGQSAQFAYFDNAGDRRLRQIRNVAPGGAPLSQFDYTFNAVGDIGTWTAQAGANPADTLTLAYDLVSQLTAATASSGSFSFSYDKVGNRLTRTASSSGTTSFGYNLLNEIQSASPALGADKVYTWDAANQLVGIAYPGTALNTRFTYDGIGRRVGITELNGSTIATERRFVWCGDQLCEERDAAGNVTRRFFDQGEQVGGTNYFYSFDHLGSVRELTDAAGAVRARYDYDPFGVRTKVSGDLEPSAGYTGHFVHAPSGLHLTRTRAYDAASGRWLSRDPLGEVAGLNLYAYVGNNPVNAVDPLGLVQWRSAAVAAAGIAGGAVAAVGGGAIALGGATATVTLPVIGQVAGPLVAIGGGAVAANGAYGVFANSANLLLAITDQPALSQGSPLTDASAAIFPGSKAAAVASNLVDGALGIASGNLGGSVKVIFREAARADQILNIGALGSTGSNVYDAATAPGGGGGNGGSGGAKGANGSNGASGSGSRDNPGGGGPNGPRGASPGGKGSPGGGTGPKGPWGSGSGPRGNGTGNCAK